MPRDSRNSRCSCRMMGGTSSSIPNSPCVRQTAGRVQPNCESSVGDGHVVVVSRYLRFARTSFPRTSVASPSSDMANSQGGPGGSFDWLRSNSAACGDPFSRVKSEALSSGQVPKRIRRPDPRRNPRARGDPLEPATWHRSRANSSWRAGSLSDSTEKSGSSMMIDQPSGSCLAVSEGSVRRGVVARVLGVAPEGEVVDPEANPRRRAWLALRAASRSHRAASRSDDRSATIRR